MKLLTAEETLRTIQENKYWFANFIVSSCTDSMIKTEILKQTFDVGSSFNKLNIINAELACEVAKSLGYKSHWEKAYDEKFKFEKVIFYVY